MTKASIFVWRRCSWLTVTVTKWPTSGHRQRTGGVLISPRFARLATGYQTVIKFHITRLFGC